MLTARDQAGVECFEVAVVYANARLVEKGIEADHVDEVVHQRQPTAVFVAVREGSATSARTKNDDMRAAVIRCRNSVSIQVTHGAFV